MNKYINDLLHFVESIDIKIGLLHHEKCEVIGDKRHHSMNLYINSSQPKRYSFSINQTAIFMLLDAFVDHLYPELASEGFTQKYNRLPSHSNCEKVIKGTFRILRIVRNALIHEMDAVKINPETINIVRKKQSKEILKIKHRAINALNFIIWYSAKNDLSVYYNELVLVSAYNLLLRGITEVKDALKDDFSPIQAEITLKSFRRFEVTGMKVEKSDDRVIVQREFFKTTETDKVTGIEHRDFNYAYSDYSFEMDNKKYFIPDECLTESTDKNTGYILLKDLYKFENK